MQIRDLTPEELADIQTVVDFDNKERPADQQLTVQAAIDAQVEKDVAHFRERARKINAAEIGEKFVNATNAKRQQVLTILSE